MNPSRPEIFSCLDFHLEFASGDHAAAGPLIFVAMQEQLGLKLEPATAPREFLVIDHIEKPLES